MLRRGVLKIGRVVISAVLLLLPLPAAAQSAASIAGAVKDTSGAVLPGVTVEVASPVLIEKVRIAVTDSQGQYRVIDLRPGTYAVTFTLPGFNTLKREGIELATGLIANVDAELPVGALTETITVTGQSPLVDVQSSTQTVSFTQTQIDLLPTGKTWQNYVSLIPGVTSNVQDVGGNSGDKRWSASIHGSDPFEMTRLFDGMRYGNIGNRGSNLNGSFPINNAMVQEISVETSGSLAEYEVSGLHPNLIPKQGGNNYSVYAFANFANDSMQSNNLDDELRARGVPTPTVLTKIWEVNPAFGGPLKKDKMWFYGSYRYTSAVEAPPGAYYDTDPADFVFTPDLTRTAVSPAWTHSWNLRVTWQAARNLKLNMYADNHDRCTPCSSGLNSLTAWESTFRNRFADPEQMFYVTGVWAPTGRLLVEVGETYRPEVFDFQSQPGIPLTRSGMIETRTGVKFRNWTTSSGRQRTDQFNGRGSLAYVTGSHNLKVGTQWFHGRLSRFISSPNDYFISLLDGNPISVTLVSPFTAKENLKMNLGLYAQEQWTRQRLTLNVGIRYDYLNLYVAEQDAPANQYVGARHFDEIPNVPNWKDVSSRFGAAYDLFGTGKTALKWSAGRFVEAQGQGIPALVNPLATNSTSTRAWNDRNADFIPQEAELGPHSNANFGRPVVPVRFDPEVITGWGTRTWNWETSAAIAHELRPGLSVDASYHRRWYGNFRVTDNLLRSPSDYDQFCVTSPVDSRLPGGGGQQICGLYDLKTTVPFGASDNVITAASNFGEQTQVYDGFDIGFNVRLPGGTQVQGGTSTGRTKTSVCFAVDSPQALLFCEVKPPFQTQVKFSAIYPLPWGLLSSATYQGLPGPQITASWAAPASAVTGLGRPLAGGARTVTVPLVAPGSMYGDFLHQIDFRIAKNFMLGDARIQPQFDLFNLFNANPVLAQNNTFGPAWQRPVTILLGRMIKFGVQFDF